MENDIQDRVNEAISDFVAATESLKAAPSQDSAEEACLTCRDAVQLFFFSRDDYRSERPDKVEELIDALDVAAAALKELADQPDADVHLAQYRDSVLRRKGLVDAVKEGSVAKIREILQEGWDAAQLSHS